MLWIDVDEVEEIAFRHLLPGKEGFFESHAGGEAELCQFLFDSEW